MARYCFYLKEPKSKRETVVKLHVHYHAKICKCYSKVKVLPTNWDSKKQKVKHQVAQSTKMNEILNTLRKDAEDAYLSLVDEKIDINNDNLRRRIYDINEPKETHNLNNFFSSYIKTQKQLSKSTLSDYRQTLNTLKDFENNTKYKVEFDSINLLFYDKFKIFILDKKRHSINTFGKRIKVIKTIMRAALDRELHNNLTFNHKEFKTTEETIKQMYLDKEDVKKLVHLNIENDKLEEVKNIFLLMCLLGIRISDFHQLSENNIKKTPEGHVFTFQCTKTNNFVSIPIISKGIEIIEQYNYQLPKIDDNTINKNIKKVAELVKIDSKFTNNKGTFKKYEVITSKTARISFATNAYVNTKMPKRSIMVITGHKKESSFDRYVQAERPPSHEEVYEIYGDLN